MITTRAVVAVAAVVAVGSGVAMGRMPSSAAGDQTPQAAVSSIAATGPSGATGATGSTGPQGSVSEEAYPASGAAPQLAAATKENGVSVRSSIKTKNPVFFITIDDGWDQPKDAADYVVKSKLPVTVFLTENAVSGGWDFFKKMATYDRVQNHSMTHVALSKKSANRQYEICSPQTIYSKKYGVKPWILRPPYGAGFMPKRVTTPLIEKAAAGCGITQIALWNVSVSKEGKMSFAGNKFQKGDIVLLHFDGPNLKVHLQMVVREYAKHGLKPASLSAYLTR